MASYSRVLLSGSTNGKPIIISQTATAGNTIHTAINGTSSYDEIYVWVSNVTATAATITIEYGGVTDPGNLIVKAYSIPANSIPIPIITGQVLNNSLICSAFSGTASALNVTGYVNRIS